MKETFPLHAGILTRANVHWQTDSQTDGGGALAVATNLYHICNVAYSDACSDLDADPEKEE